MSEELNNKTLWFAQTLLSEVELQRFWHLIGKRLELDEEVNLEEIIFALQCMKMSASRLLFLISGLRNCLLFENDNIITRKHISLLRKKNLPHEFPLAVQCGGNSHVLSQKTIAIIGSRDPMQRNEDRAKFFTTELSQNEYTIISGGARGIDTIAHETALSQSGGKTCVVFGSALDYPYPFQNKELFTKILKSTHGLILSEFSRHSPMNKYNFLKRNHTIVNLADFVLVVEAKKNSGTYKAAQAALSRGIAVGVIIDADMREGSLSLLREGAIAISHPGNIEKIIKIRELNFKALNGGV